jgi:hypothetical protein
LRSKSPVILNLVNQSLVGLPIADVVYGEAGIGVSEVSLRDGPEAFLACRVPHLQFDWTLVYLQGFEFEVKADGAMVSVVKVAVYESKEQRSFACVAFAD